MTASNAEFNWKCHPQAEALCLKILQACCQANSDVNKLQEDLLEQTSTRLLDWVDHFEVGGGSEFEKNAYSSGYVQETVTAEYRVIVHPGAQLPRIVVYDSLPSVIGVAVSVEDIADFLMVRGHYGWIEGIPLSIFRRCSISEVNDVKFWIVERRATGTMLPHYGDEHSLEKYEEAKELWKTRLRHSREGEEEQIRHALELASELVTLLGQDLAAWIILECERDYWERRNRAAQVQKNRQDRLGMGWANHDHHTFRSSRQHFVGLVRLFEILGFHCRERFYAGAEAGWGAQVMENLRCKLVLFLDVDLLPEEVEIDFAHRQLQDVEKLGTVGLWCALHGDSILRSGMHHLEAQFLFENLTDDLAHQGIAMMKPFSDFSYLKQAFTSPEKWEVDPKQIDKLQKEGKITLEQAEKFKVEGAVGSHLENLQRRDGYKGFNQNNVSTIIKATDPRSS
ncbi:MAG: hypothetical protein H0W50_09465 [Parachlamydiaceae bacterium]|nr:hypothetical protein [Parachlamydiaceae bacterium]